MPDNILKPPPGVAKLRQSSVQKAREVYAEKAKVALDMYLQNIRKAMKAGNHDVAMKSLQWLMEHAPAEANGVRMLDPTIDTRHTGGARADQPALPTVNIGFRIGGMPIPVALPPAPDVIDITPEPEQEPQTDGPTEPTNIK